MMPNKPNGKLLLVGLGPGDAIHQTPAAANALSECDVLVGYRGYIEQVSGSLPGKELVPMELGQEMERAARAVDLASEGRTVVVVSSGDAGIYGMAGPVFRVLTDREWDGMDPSMEVVPGISALQSAASLLGAPLMQDFCAISLSDLLTPWEAIERRLQSRRTGGFRRRALQPPQPAPHLATARGSPNPHGAARREDSGGSRQERLSAKPANDRHRSGRSGIAV